MSKKAAGKTTQPLNDSQGTPARQAKKPPPAKKRTTSDPRKQKAPVQEPSDPENTPHLNANAVASDSIKPTSEMEVHHHPDLEHKPKPIKEYLLEGLMIFIAVMMGFIAENIREAIDNSEQAHHLTTQLVQDLRADTAQLDSVYMAEGAILKANDSLFTTLQQPLASIDTKKMQELIIASHSMWPFHPSVGAMGAIKNQIHLKQFSNSKIIGLIARYEQHIELLHTVQDITLLYQRNYLDPFLLQHFTPKNLYTSFDNKPVPNGQMRNLSQNDLEQLSADIVLIRTNTNELLLDHGRLRKDLNNLLQYVKQEYDQE
jgi:hypothetical protein